MTLVAQETECALCQLPVDKGSVRSGDHTFCCLGCRAVFEILSAKGQLDGFQDHPIFREAMQSGLISNPAVLKEAEKRRAELGAHETQKIAFEIEEMWCPSCAEVIKLYLLQQRGVVGCVVDYSSDLAHVEFSPEHTSTTSIFEKITSLGYVPKRFEDPTRALRSALGMRFAITTFLALNIMMFSYPVYASYFGIATGGYDETFRLLSLAFSIPLITYGAWPIFRRFLLSLQVGLFGMETLVVMGVSAAFSLSCYSIWQGSDHIYFDSMAAIIVFMLLGKMVETKAKSSAKEISYRLARSKPKRCRKVLPDGSEAFVDLKEIEVGDRFVVLKGEQVACDGEVETGEGWVDQSALTGEAVPLSKGGGDVLLAGCVVVSGRLVIKVTESPNRSAIEKIIQMVEHDLVHKPKYERAADKVVRWFVPIVLTIASAVAGGLFLTGHDMETSVLRFISIVLISCPCALGIAAPIAEAHLISGLGSLGAIVRNRGCLSLLGGDSIYAFDKTGTITEGRLRVVEGLEELEDEKVLSALVRHSIHPVAKALQECLPDSDIQLVVEETAGRGLQAEYRGAIYRFGSHRLLQDAGIEASGSGVFFAKDSEVITELQLEDRLREEIPRVIQDLDCETWLLSGDHRNTVERVAGQATISRWKAEMTPLEKKMKIEKLRKNDQTVVMVGDGINDAPALTAASIGISVLSASDLSLTVSDITLTDSDLSRLPLIRKLARKGRGILQQNLFWAFSYNVVGVGLAAVGKLAPLFAAFAMVASSLIVVANSRRLGSYAKKTRSSHRGVPEYAGSERPS